MKKMAVMAAAALLLVAAGSFADEPVVGTGKSVSFDYTLTVDGAVTESTLGKAPMSFNAGRGEIVSGLETAMTGMKAGDHKTVTVPPQEGYGPVRPDAFRDFDRSRLPAGFEPKVGMLLEMKDEAGDTYPARIAAVDARNIRLDFNHPLAGKELVFDVTVVSVR